MSRRRTASFVCDKESVAELFSEPPARCVGETALGVRVIYLPLHGYAGKDEPDFTVAR